MVREAFEVILNLRVLHDIMTGKGFQGCHAEEAKVHVHGEP